MTPWSTEAGAIEGNLVRLSIMLSVDPGPLREFRPFLDVDLDETHAVQLLGQLSLAVSELQRTRWPAR